MKNPVNYYIFEHEGEFTSTMVLSATPADMINALVTGSLEKKVLQSAIWMTTFTCLS